MNKLEISQAKEISKSAEANITNMAAAMNLAPIEDYSKVPYEMCTDWKIILKMNDNEGKWHNFLDFSKRRDLIQRIRKYEEVNYGIKQPKTN